MSSKKIYIIRHGQTDYNKKGIVQGSGIDTSLNDLGKAQAHAFYSFYKNVQFDVIYTSELKRSQESVASFSSLNIPTRAFAGLNEINWGEKEGMRITPEEDAYYHRLLKAWQDGNTELAIDGGESPQDVADRQRPVIHELLNTRNEKNVLVCMHGRAIRVLLCQLLNYPLRAMDCFEHRNLCLYLLNFTGTMMSVEKYNNIEHLASLN